MIPAIMLAIARDLVQYNAKCVRVDTLQLLQHGKGAIGKQQDKDQ